MRPTRRLFAALALAALASIGLMVSTSLTESTPGDTTWGAPATATADDTTWGTPPAHSGGDTTDPGASAEGDTTWG